MTMTAYQTVVSEEDVDVALNWLSTHADEAAKARAERAYVEEFRKSVKARIMAEHADKPLGTQERYAYADSRYIAHLDAIKEAVFRDERLRFQKEAALAKVDAWRTGSANRRGSVF